MSARRIAAALSLAATLAAASAQGQGDKTTAQGIDEYRAALQDGNPAELTEARGEELWRTPRGPKRATLEACDLGLGPGVVKGAYAGLPRWFADTQQVMNLEARLVHCIASLQGFDRAEVVRQPFSREGERQTDLEALVAYVVAQSRGMTIAVPQSHPQERAAYRRGERLFWYRGGPYDFSCASCHGESGKRIRLQELPNLTLRDSARSAYASWPAYRVSQGAVRTFEWRLYDCFRQQRFPELIYNSQAAIDLNTFLAVNANGGVLQAPAIKR
jgi:sulfur-oxidizing protein SoxA